MLKALGGFASAGGGVGAVTYKGTWDAATNTPTLASGTGTQGDYYVVNVAGSTNLDGITDWNIGDWAIFNGTVWEKVDNTDSVTSVNGQVGTVVLDYSDVGAPAANGASATGTWGINVTGSAASATNVSVDIEVANVSMFPVLVAASGITRPKVDGGNNFRYNPGTDTLTIPNISGTNVTVTNVTSTNVSATTFTGNLTGNVTGTASSANTATISTNIAGGATGSLPYQSNANVTTFLAAGSDGEILRLASGVPTWSAEAGAPIVVTNLVTITSADGAVIPWQNNSLVVIPWQNNVPQDINWINNIYAITSNNATILVDSASGSITPQLPAAASVSGQQYKIKKIDSSNNAVTITTTSSQTIDGSVTYSLPTQYESATVQSDGSNWWVTATVV